MKLEQNEKLIYTISTEFRYKSKSNDYSNKIMLICFLILNKDTLEVRKESFKVKGDFKDPNQVIQELLTCFGLESLFESIKYKYSGSITDINHKQYLYHLKTRDKVEGYIS